MKRIGMMMTCAGLALCLAGAATAQDTKSADKAFIKNAIEGSQAEINFAKLALAKSQDTNVRQFAEKMIKDHSKLIADMRPFAAKYGVTAPGAPVMAHAKYDELKLKTGTDFDRGYVEAMVKDHNDDLKDFIQEENSTADPALKATVAKGEQVVKEHTEMIDNIAHMGGIETPPMP